MKKKPRKSDEDGNIKLFRQMWTQTQWIRTPKAMWRVLPYAEVGLLCYLINIEEMNPVEDVEEENLNSDFHWFFCTTSRIEAELGMSRSKQERLFSSLRDKNLLRTEMRNKDGSNLRFISIEWKALYTLLNGA